MRSALLRARATMLTCAALVLLQACSDLGDSTVPPIVAPEDPPTWEADVRAILEEHCVSCHGNPPTEGAPLTFRLDKYDANEGGDGVPGAFEQATRVRARTVLQRTMPPGGGVPLTQRNLVDAWVRAGAPRD